MSIEDEIQGNINPYHNKPHNKWSKKYSGIDVYDDLKKDIYDDKILKRLWSASPLNVNYSEQTDLYCIEGEFSEDSKLTNPESKRVFCPKFSMVQLFCDLYGIGDICKLIRNAKMMDGKLKTERDWNNIDGKVKQKLRTDNMDRINKILVDVHKIKRNEGKRASILHYVEDHWDIKGRAWVGGTYQYKSDMELCDMTLKEAQDLDLELLYAEATPFKTKMYFGKREAEKIGDQPVIIGVIVQNSEFKRNVVSMESYISFPEIDGHLYGAETKRLEVRIPHLISNKHITVEGDDGKKVKRKMTFNEIIKEGFNLAFDRKGWIRDLFENKSRENLIDIDLGTTYQDDNNNERYALQDALGIGHELASKILTIHTLKGFPSNVIGLSYALMNFIKNDAETEHERERFNNITIKNLRDPEKFYTEMDIQIDERSISLDIDLD